MAPNLDRIQTKCRSGLTQHERQERGCVTAKVAKHTPADLPGVCSAAQAWKFGMEASRPRPGFATPGRATLGKVLATS